MTEYQPGYPTWVELASPDLEMSKHFYCEVFNWYAYTLTLDHIGEYEMFVLGDVQGPEIGGMYQLIDDSMPSSWTVYFRTDDPVASLDLVREAGGRVLVEPLDVAHLGRLAQASDPQGADFGLWLPYDLKGAGVVDEASAMCWAEVSSPDPDAGRGFYSHVFGWKPVDRTYYGRPYVEFKVGERSVAGMVAPQQRWAPDVFSHWMPYFWVSDCDAAVARAAELGARIHVPPVTIETGRLAIMSDPGGARLAVVTPVYADLQAAKLAP
ncbi:VOC family protein [Actinomadura sp. GC306]|uniref:VOC family protein n=1 Tax=Actinomadura sp. GC306 TaxID=2530367 RepID=UPI00104DF5A7|nr:VOC family protein [Actinomadura sp. GC306]TDC60200.1 VOC family protein [Actinomadura sp. GC306]